MGFDYQDTPGDTDWFVRDRFGMFIHWGVYAAAGRHEWVRMYENLTEAEYQKYFAHFNPDLYDPVEWAKLAKQAGMKYFVITSKHHDGCCLWDSKLTDWKVTNTPAGRDHTSFRRSTSGLGATASFCTRAWAISNDAPSSSIL